MIKMKNKKPIMMTMDQRKTKNLISTNLLERKLKIYLKYFKRN